MHNKKGTCRNLQNIFIKYCSFFLLAVFSVSGFSESASLLDRIFYPQYVGPFKFNNRTDFKDETGAVAYEYTVQVPEQAYLTVYYYPLDDKFDDDTRKKYLSALFHQSKEAVNIRFKNVDLISEGGFEIPGTKNVILRSVFEADINGSRQYSVIYTMFDKNNILKIRGTYPKNFDHKDHLQGYLNEIMEHFVVDPKIVVNQQAFEGQSTDTGAAWLSYGMAKIQWSLEHERMSHTFDEEVYAQTTASKIWEELKAKKAMHDSYLDTLVNIRNNGFMREYIWDFYHKTYWQKPDDLDMSGYNQWKTINLKDHKPIEDVGIYIR